VSPKLDFYGDFIKSCKLAFYVKPEGGTQRQKIAKRRSAIQDLSAPV